MRLGQLARQLDVKTTDIVTFLEKEKKTTIKTHPNSKVPDELIEEVSAHFKPEEKEVEEKPAAIEQKEETPVIPEQPKEEKKKVQPEPEIPLNPEHIETPKTELQGPKIIGKVDLPDKSKIQVEIDGVVYDQEFLDKKKKDELKQLREQKAIEKEEKRKAEKERKRIALEKKKLEEERQAMLAQEKHNILSAEEEKKKALILKAQEKREKKLEANRKKRQKQYYQQQVTTKQPQSTKKKKKKEIEQEVITVQTASEPKETNLFKRFIKWLNT